MGMNKKCTGCFFHHIGKNVDHNHCDLPRSNPYGWDEFEKNANGRIHYINGKKIEMFCRFGIQEITQEKCPECGIVGKHTNTHDVSGLYHKRKRKCDNCGYVESMLA